MKRLALLVPVLGLAACSTDPANVAGTYSIAVTEEANTCPLANWTQGNSTSNIPVVITQDNDSATAQVTGTTGDYLKLVLGSNTFSGTLDGSHLSLMLFGNVSETMNNCAYTYSAQLEAGLSGDTLTGTIVYTPNPSGSPTNCTAAMVTGCMATQNFNGTRPPT